MTLPTVITKSGLQPQTASSLRQQLVDSVAANNPGYTANLPGSLIEDIASTDVAAIAQCDSARVELVNSLTPYGANEFLLTQLGNIYGVQQGTETNTSVNVTFTGPAGFVIQQGFTVSDGTYQYIAQDGGIIGSGGTVSIYCVADQSGSWAVPENSVNQLVTSVPAVFGISCNNPIDGVSGGDIESIENYRARVLESGRAASQGMATYLRTLLGNIPGVQKRLITIIKGTGTWKIVCGGGDPYTVGYAIFRALFDISNLVGSATTARNITVTINDYPDAYDITYVNPPAQAVSMLVTWNTTLTSFVSAPSVAQLAAQALSNYINTLQVGYSMNLFELQAAFQDSVAELIPQQFLSRLVFAVYINSVLVNPTAGTGLITGDTESYFQTSINQITITQG